jgi:membrane-bound serine protease (ClpP class)
MALARCKRRSGIIERVSDHRRRLRAAALIAPLLLAGLLALPAKAEDHRVLLVEVKGAITPVIANFLIDSVEAGAREGFQLIVVALDTPGGLDTSMREIVQAFLGAPIPVVVYVSPEGARAASAGTFITMAAHIAVMAPATSIGAATPVDMQGGEITDKIINDAVAFGVSVAELRGRSTEFAEASIREGRSVTARQAVELGVVDLVATDLDDLLDQIDGREIDSLDVTIHTADAQVERREMGPLRTALGRLADPNLAFLFLSLGTLAIIYEAANPGLGFSGIAGVLMLVLAFFALSVLPVQAAGIAFFVVGIALLVAELFVPGVGVLAAGGTISLLLSALFLFEGPVRVSPVVFLPSVVILGASSLLAGRAAWRARRRPATSGPDLLVGKEATVALSRDREMVFLDGTWWEVQGREGRPVAGERVKVVRREGVYLLVEEVDDDI